MTIKKRSVMISGHATSLSLEELFWRSLQEIAEEEGVSLAQIIEQIDEARSQSDPPNGNLSSAVRLHVLQHLRQRAGLRRL